MKSLTMLAIFLLVTLAVPTLARLGNTKGTKMEIIEVFPELVEVVEVEEQQLKGKLQACANPGDSCVHIPCCPLSSGNMVVCATSDFNAICVDMGPPCSWC
ncbi:uncharacterized protein LOC104891713 [Beta vulgaris subsp. vulgaris]|uniref:uncharacterized protein LOC104891713 n=1 Tax=Beta vulgaris subsp. vulgaris TaxID=3555 RepID=UPI00203711DE|nr:uncharacterized protein LOC104891713 [Beta vulgaris subsp. vulgaris]